MKQGVNFKRTAIFTVLFLLLFQWSSLFPQTASAATVENAAMVSIIDENGNSILPLTVVEINNDETAFDVLKEVTKEKNINFEYTTDPKWGVSVDKIGNSKPVFDDNGSYWGFIVNGVAATVGVSSYTIEKGDDLLFKVVDNSTKTVTSKVSALDKKGNDVLPETKVELMDGANAYDALKQATEQKKLKLETTIDANWFAYVNNLGDTKLGEGDYWSLNLNGEGMQVGLSSYQIKTDDHLELKLVGPEETTPSDGSTDNNGGTDGSTDEDTTTNTVSKQQLQQAIKSTTSYILKNGGTDEFEAVALQNAGSKIPTSYLNNIKKTLQNRNGTFRNVTDYERLALGVTAAGGDATDIIGYDLIKGIYSNDRMTNQGTNGVVYALLAYDSKNYKVPSSAKWTREKLVSYLLEHQLQDGGWALYGDSPSVDITAMTIAALGPYKAQDNVKKAINTAVNWLADEQDPNGGFSSTVNGGDSSETTAQVIIALSTVGIDPTSTLFTKSGTNLIEHLMMFQKKDGGFAHVSSDSNSNIMATTQALIALTAYEHLGSNKGSVYQFNDVTNQPATNNEQTPKDNSHSTPPSNKTQQGGALPNTATNHYNLLFVGVLLLLIGGGLYVNNRKKRV